MYKAPPAPLPWASFGTTIMAVQNLKHLSFGARAPQEADAFFRLVVRSLSFVIIECIHEFARIE
jgi:hypothetical protein